MRVQVQATGTLLGAGESMLVWGGPTLEEADGVLALAEADASRITRIPGIWDDGRSGVGVAGAGDVNGDGFDDLLIGAPGANSGQGMAYLIYGSNTMPATFDLASGIRSEVVQLQGSAEDQELGAAVSGAGDVNGDGLSDFLVGSPRCSFFGPPYAGRVYLIFGSTAALAGTDGILALEELNGENGGWFNGNEPGGRLGDALSGAGDVNGDGYDDMLLGEPDFDSARGRVLLACGTPEYGQGTTPVFSHASLDYYTGNYANGNFGKSLSGAGDVNGDGLDDFIVGEPGKNRALVFFGNDAISAPKELRLSLRALGKT